MKNKKTDDATLRRAPLMSRLAGRLDIPPDILSGIHLELRGRGSLTVRGCRKILLYTPLEVRLQLRGEVLRLRGTGLYCTAYRSGVIEIDGIIDNIGFCGEGEDK